MEKVLDFVVDNYLWFIIISIVLVFALIGYFIDSKNMKEEKKEEKNLSLDEETAIIQEETLKEETAAPVLETKEKTVLENVDESQAKEEVVNITEEPQETEVTTPSGMTLTEQIRKNAEKTSEDDEVKPISLGTVNLEAMEETIEKKE